MIDEATATKIKQLDEDIMTLLFNGTPTREKLTLAGAKCMQMNAMIQKLRNKAHGQEEPRTTRG